MDERQSLGDLLGRWQELSRLRGPLAYVFGHLYLRRGQRDDALMFFRTALKDAAADSPLQRLARQEVTSLGDK